MANNPQIPIAPHEKGGAKRKYAAIEPQRDKEKSVVSSGLIDRSGFELSHKKTEQAFFRIGNALRESLEIYDREGIGVRLRDVREAIYVTWTKHEVLTQDEVRMWLAAGSRGVG